MRNDTQWQKNKQEDNGIKVNYRLVIFPTIQLVCIIQALLESDIILLVGKYLTF